MLGYFGCFCNPLNSHRDCGIFSVQTCDLFACSCTQEGPWLSHPKDFCSVCTDLTPEKSWHLQSLAHNGYPYTVVILFDHAQLDFREQMILLCTTDSPPATQQWCMGSYGWKWMVRTAISSCYPQERESGRWGGEDTLPFQWPLFPVGWPEWSQGCLPQPPVPDHHSLVCLSQWSRAHSTSAQTAPGFHWWAASTAK